METSFSVAYIDTAGTFSSIQLQEMGKGRGKDEVIIMSFCGGAKFVLYRRKSQKHYQK